MSSKTSDSKRLAKNTLLLYLRTLLVMAISLYTSRVILARLGVEDYGIYDIVGGFVGMLGVISGTLVATSQRYLNFELGKAEGANPRKVFGASMIIHIGLSLFLLLLFETLGLWLLNTYLKIPGGRLIAANWVYQCSILAFLVNILSTPYTAIIIAHEKMSAFAYISLVDVILKLIVVYFLYISPYDRLVVYAIMLLMIALFDRFLYSIYCRRHFPESSFTFVKDKALYKEMFGFAGMNFLGAFASVLSNHGMNVLLNIFFGVTINAARGISTQVQNAVVKFVNDFMTAINPQITKEYASGNIEKSKDLCFKGSKFSYFIMFLLALPIIVRAPYILRLWLKVYPDYAVLFVRLSLILSLCVLLSKALVTEILATGNLKRTALWIGGIRLLTIPIAYFVFVFGYGPEYSYVVLIGIEIMSVFVRLKILEHLTNSLFILPFLNIVLSRVALVTLTAGALIYSSNKVFAQDFLGLLSFCFVSIVLSSIVILLLGLTQSERTIFFKFLKSRIAFNK